MISVGSGGMARLTDCDLQGSGLNVYGWTMAQTVHCSLLAAPRRALVYPIFSGYGGGLTLAGSNDFTGCGADAIAVSGKRL